MCLVVISFAKKYSDLKQVNNPQTSENAKSESAVIFKIFPIIKGFKECAYSIVVQEYHELQYLHILLYWNSWFSRTTIE